jgi:hypothetical protein
MIPPSLQDRNLRFRNLRLGSCFKYLTEEDAKKRVEDQGLFVFQGTSAKEFLAELVLTKASLPLRSNETALQSLTGYCSHAVDEASIARLEHAYRAFGLIGPNH